ncbi:MAG: response regulator [SAR324 cluster bacterium]|nr:response regulator [SAR324 cluster bacterium]
MKKQAKILIVDDDQLISEALSEMLRLFGYDCGFILHPKVLFPRLEDEPFDLILLDINLPEIDGVTLLCQIKEHEDFQKIPVIMLTGAKEDELVATCLQNGATDFINKPIRTPILKARIATALEAKATKEELEVRVKERTADLNASRKKLVDANHQLEKSYRELQNAQAQLIQSSKLASLGEMATGIAHELNQPLFTIRMSANNLIKADEKDIVTDPLPPLKKIIRQVDRASQIINHLRTFGRDSTLTPKKEADLNGIIEDALSMINEQFIKRDIIIISELSIEPLIIHCQPVQIEQVLINLLTNAKDALATQAIKKIRLRSFFQDQWIIAEVLDTGTGIPSEIKEKIFDPFFTTKDVGVGTGLGLSISYGIIRDHQGKLEVESEPGESTCFRLYFPKI